MSQKIWHKRNKKVYISDITSNNVPIIGYNLVTDNYINSIIIEPYTVVNLLGSYGGFSVDSNNDGVADGWIKTTSTNMAFSIASNTQTITMLPGEHTANAHLQFNFSMNVNDKIFYRATVKTDDVTYGDKAFLISYTFSTPGNFAIAFDRNTEWQTKYRTYTSPSNTNMFSLRCIGHYTPPLTLPYTINTLFKQVIVVNLTTMGELPQSLKQFFAPSNITKWEDLATSNNITAYDGTVKSGNDWLNELIPYVDSVATVGGYWDNSLKQFVISTQKLELRRNLIDFGKEYITNTKDGIGFWKNDRTIEGFHNMSYGTNTYRLHMNKTYFKKTLKVFGTIQNKRGYNFVGLYNNLQGWISALNNKVNSTTPTVFGFDNFYLDFFNSHNIVTSVKVWLDGSKEPKEDEKRSITFKEKTVFPLIGFNGIYDRLFITKNKITVTKFWNTVDSTTNGSGDVTLSNSVSDTQCIVINKTNGETKILTLSGTTVSTGWNNTNVTIIYRVNPQKYDLTPLLDISGDLRYIKGLMIYLLNYDYDIYKYGIDNILINTGDEVYLNGIRVPNDVIFNDTLNKLAKYGDEVVVLRPKSDQILTPVLLETLTPVNTQKEILFIENIDISEEQDVTDIRKEFISGFEPITNIYNIKMTIGILEGEKTFYEQYKDKTFHLKIFDSSTNKNVVLTPCKILEPSTVNVLDGTEEVTIFALKKIEEV